MLNRRSFLLASLLALSVHRLALSDPLAGRDYQTLAASIGTDSAPGKIEVAEFFWYRCPHCFELEPALNSWIKTLPGDVAIRRIPAVLNNDWAVQARVWYALREMGVADKYHDAFFNAIHLDGLDATSEINIFDWAGRVGMNRTAFANAYNSFAVQTRVMQAAQLTRDAQITGVPSFVVDGRFVTSVSMTGSEKALFATLNALIDKVRKEHRR